MRPASSVVARALVAFALTGGFAGCAGTSAAERAARAQDFRALRSAIDAEVKAGELDDDHAADIAEAIAEGDLGAQKGWRGADAVLAWQACAADVADALSDRGDGEDDPAAAALWLLVAAGEEDADDFAEHDQDDTGGSAWWRSLGARGLTDDDDALVRRRRLRDGEERVRLGAVRAASDALDPEDLPALLEAARLDPLPAARAAAVRAVGLIGGTRAADGLRDVWTRADPNLRQTITSAWAAYPTYATGGQRELLRVAEHEGGDAAVAAAVHLARLGGAHASFARGALARAITSGTRRERVFAIAAAPHAEEIVAAVRLAAKDRDVAVAASALARLVREGDEKEQKAAREELLRLARGDDTDARAARGELARAGDARVLPLAVKALTAPLGHERAAAARDLASLGSARRAAILLADRERDVRVAAACAILGAQR